MKNLVLKKANYECFIGERNKKRGIALGLIPIGVRPLEIH
jgi:hypothetical protein